MFISCIVLKTKDEVKELSTAERENYKSSLITEYHRHRTGVQENPFQYKELKETSLAHMNEVYKQIEWIEKKC